jgi:hypothetical protein
MAKSKTKSKNEKLRNFLTAINKIQSRIPNNIPVRGWVIESILLGLLSEIVRICLRIQFVAEWRKPAKCDIQYYTQRPDIHRSTVTSELGHFENFWSSILYTLANSKPRCKDKFWNGV